MKKPGKYAKRCYIYVICLLFAFQLLGETEIKLVKILKFPTESGLQSMPWDFCVTYDGLFMIPDPHAGNTKIFKLEKGKEKKDEQEKPISYLVPVDILGHKGIGEKEFIEPTYCFTDRTRYAVRYGVYDFSNRKIAIYMCPTDDISKKRSLENTEKRFVFERSIHCPRAGNDFELSGTKLYISGFHPDSENRPYDLYSIDISNKVEFFLPSHIKYGLANYNEYIQVYRGDDKLKSIGIDGWFDIFNETIYYAWKGRLRIIKIDKASKAIDSSFFKTNSQYFTEPVATEKLLLAHKQKNIELAREGRLNESYITNIFATSSYLFLIYKTKPANRQSPKVRDFRIQIYDYHGNCLDDVAFPGKVDKKMFVDKENNALYSLYFNNETNDHSILKFRLPVKIN